MRETATLRAGIYARQSLGNKKSIGEQDDLCTGDAELLGWQVADHYEDRVSASRFGKSERPGWVRLVSDLEASKLDVVVVWEASRGDRKLTTWSAFLDLCAATRTLIRVTDAERTLDPIDPADWEWLAREGINAVTESNKLSKRCRRGQMGQAKSGRPHGRVPYGYIRRYDPVTRELTGQEPHPEQAPVVVELIRRIAAGETLSEVAGDFNKRGLPAAGGKPWDRQRLREYVNPIYIGKRTHKGQLFDTDWWPAIVEEETFWAARRVLDSRRREGTRGSRLEYWLSGVATCSVCDGPMRGRSAGTGSTWTRDRYHCAGGTGCVSVAAEDLEAEVLAYLLGRLARPDVYEQLRRVDQTADREAQAARDEVARLEAQLEDWRKSATDGRGTTAVTLAVVEADLTVKIKAANRRADLVSIPPPVRVLLDGEGDLPERWAAMSIAARRDVAQALVTVTVRPAGGRGVRKPIAERVTVEWKRAA